MKQHPVKYPHFSRFIRNGLICALALAAPVAISDPGYARLDMDNVHWSFKSDQFLCELKLPLKKMGLLAFSHPAGHTLRLSYTPVTLFPEQVQVAMVTPPWRAEARSQFEPMSPAKDMFRLHTDHSRSVFGALDQGLWTLLSFDDKEFLIPTIRFEEFAEPFRLCQTQLSPLSVRQARDTAFYFKRGQRALSEVQLQEIDLIGRYVQLDERVSKLLVDSYTDNTGTHASNLQISRERAADVTAALVEAGVPKDLIEQRSHGYRYPVADNSSTETQDMNRKVTIRVIRQTSEETQ